MGLVQQWQHVHGMMTSQSRSAEGRGGWKKGKVRGLVKNGDEGRQEQPEHRGSCKPCERTWPLS